MKAQLGTRRNRLGFTLIELVVVLMILVALAGIIIPAITNMVTRTHASTGAGNISECTNAIARYEAQYMSYPNNLDSLKVDSTAGADDFVFAAGATNGLGEELLDATATFSLTASEVDALVAAGISSVREHSVSDDATFQPSINVESVAVGSDLYTLTAPAATSVGLVNEANRYLVLGIGNGSTAIGRTMSEAPVHFPENGVENPAVVYNRFLAVFDLGPVADRFERVRFVKVISSHGSGLDGHMGEYFEDIADNQ